MFGWGRGADVEKRADKLRVLVAFITTNLHTKSFVEFAAFYSEFAAGEPSTPLRVDEFSFGFKFSQGCWYDAFASFHEPRSVSIVGGGDDYGVFITVKTGGEGAWVDLEVPDRQRPGRDAKAMVQALLNRPGFSRFSALLDKFQ